MMHRVGVSPEITRLVFPPDEPPVLLSSARAILQHISDHSADTFKKSVALIVQNDSSYADAILSLVTAGFSVVRVDYVHSTTQKCAPLEGVLRAVCESPHTGLNLSVSLIGKKSLGTRRIFDTIRLDKIRTCDMSCLNSRDDISGMIRSLQANNSLTELNVSGNMIIGDLQSWLIRPGCSLTTLNMSKCCLAGSDFVETILRQNTSLQALDISRNALFPSQVAEICDALSSNRSLLRLILSENKLNGNEERLGQAVASSNVESLDISDAGSSFNMSTFVNSLITEDPEMKRAPKRLKFLNVSHIFGSHIFGAGYGSLAAMGRCLGCVESLKANSCFRMTPRSELDSPAWLQFCTAIAESSVLRELEFENNGLTGPHMWTLCRCLLAAMQSRSSIAGNACAFRKHPNYGYFHMLCDYMRTQPHNIEAQSAGLARFNYIQILQNAAESPHIESDAAACLTQAFNYINEERYEELLSILDANEPKGSCLWQRRPALTGPFDAPALEVLKIGSNSYFGVNGALALADFLMSAPCHNLRTIDVSKCNIGMLGHGYMVEALERDHRVLCVRLGPCDDDAVDYYQALKQRLLEAPPEKVTVPWPLVNKTTFMLCMQYSPAMRGRYVPSDVFSMIFTFLRSDVIRRVTI